MRPPDEQRPDLRRLVDWLEGRLSPTDAARVARQVAESDPRTAATLEWLRGFLTMAGSSSGRDVPPRVRADLRRHFDAWRRTRVAGAAPPARQAARLVFDSRFDLAPSGVRGSEGDEATWHLAYAADEADLVLDLHRLGDHRVRIDGQVLLATDDGRAPAFTAVLGGAAEPPVTAPADGLGRFHLPSVPDGATELTVGNGELELTLELDLSEVS